MMGGDTNRGVNVDGEPPQRPSDWPTPVNEGSIGVGLSAGIFAARVELVSAIDTA
jgi:hypothetical protein